jgi:hypothetical protein
MMPGIPERPLNGDWKEYSAFRDSFEFPEELPLVNSWHHQVLMKSASLTAAQRRPVRDERPEHQERKPPDPRDANSPTPP